MSRTKNTRGSSPLDSPEMIDYKLKQEEQLINLKILHKMDRESCAKKQNRFRRTVLAVYNIVSQKLYKRKASSVEVYFRNAWRISRAQVYRFLDCAEVLKQLEDFPEQPCRERLCRSLKRLAHSRENIRILWVSVLKHVISNNQTVTSTVISSVWEELLKNRVVTIQKDARNRKGSEKISSNRTGIKRILSKSAPSGSSEYDQISSRSDCINPESTRQLPESRPRGRDDLNPNIGLYSKEKPLDDVMDGIDTDNLQMVPRYGAESPVRNSSSQEHSGAIHKDERSIPLSQWSTKSICAVDSLYHCGSMSPKEYPQQKPEISTCSTSNPISYVACSDAYWTGVETLRSKDFPSTPIFNEDHQDQAVYQTNLRLCGEQENLNHSLSGAQRYDLSNPRSINRSLGLINNSLHHSGTYTGLPFVVDGPSREYTKTHRQNIWPLQSSQPESEITSIPAKDAQDFSPARISPIDVSHYCQNRYKISMDDCKYQTLSLKSSPESDTFNFKSVYYTPSIGGTDSRSNSQDDQLPKEEIQWINNRSGYLMLQKDPSLVSQSPLDSTSTYSSIFSTMPVQGSESSLDGSTKTPEFDSISREETRQALSNSSGIVSPSLHDIPDTNLSVSMLWHPLTRDKIRTSMDQCGRFFFDDVQLTDPLLYCNN